MCADSVNVLILIVSGVDQVPAHNTGNSGFESHADALSDHIFLCNPCTQKNSTSQKKKSITKQLSPFVSHPLLCASQQGFFFLKIGGCPPPTQGVPPRGRVWGHFSRGQFFGSNFFGTLRPKKNTKIKQAQIPPPVGDPKGPWGYGGTPPFRGLPPGSARVQTEKHP